MKWLSTKIEIDGRILEMHRVFAEPVERYNVIISFCQEILEDYRRMVLKFGFQEEGEEIEFFKIHKPHILGLLIQYRKQLSFILEYPELPAHHLERSVNKKIEKISSVLSLHRDFICYLKLGKTYMDELYFLRRNRKIQSRPIMNGFNFDPDFNTSHDFLLATIKADTAFQQFLLHKLIPKSSEIGDFDGKPLLKWTGSKVALTELGFAIFHSGAVQNGNMPLKDLMAFLEKITGIDLGDYHHTSTRFRNRNNPTKFIDKMKNSLLSWMAAIDD